MILFKKESKLKHKKLEICVNVLNGCVENIEKLKLLVPDEINKIKSEKDITGILELKNNINTDLKVFTNTLLYLFEKDYSRYYNTNTAFVNSMILNPLKHSRLMNVTPKILQLKISNLNSIIENVKRVDSEF